MNVFFGVLVSILFVSVPTFAQNKVSEKAYKKAIASFNKGKAPEGFAYLRASLHADSTSKKALYALGYYHFQFKTYDSSQVVFDKLIRLYPQDTTFYQYRALTYLYTEHYEQAEMDLKKALSLDASNESAWNDLGYLYYQWGRTADAVTALDKSLSIKPSRTAWYYKALLAYDEETAIKAQEYLQNALTLDSQYPQALRLKATLLAENKKYSEASQIYEGMLNRGDIEDEDFLSWGMLYYWQKKYEDALHYFTMPEFTEDTELWYYTGLTQYQLKQYKAALESFKKATQTLDTLDESQASVFYNRAMVRFQNSDRAGALQDFFRAIYLSPELVAQKHQAGDSLQLLGNAGLMLNRQYTPTQLDSVQIAGYQDRAYAMLGEGIADNETMRLANMAIKLGPNEPESYFLRARISYFQGEPMAAMADMKKVFSLKEKNVSAYEHYWRGLVYSTMDAYENALQDFDHAIRMESSEPSYYIDRALVLAAIGNNSKALQDVNEAMKLENQGDDHSYLLLVRASLLNDMEQYTQAITDCESVLFLQPDNALAYCMRGYAYSGLNHKLKAQADFVKALQLDPEMNEAKDGLAQLGGDF